MRLDGKVAIVTGGMSGIGAAIAERFVKEGAVVIAADIAAESDAAPPRKGARLIPRKVDVSDAASVGQLVHYAVEAFSKIDVLVNSAGIGKDIPFLETPLDIFDRIVAVNLRGTFLIGQAVAREMAKSGGGRIINIASVSGRRGNTGRAAYGASKGGVVTLSEVMAVELAAHGILVNVIAPGPIDTPLVAQMHTAAARRAWTAHTPLQRYGTPAEIAGAAVFLASGDASYITGHVLHVDGGFLAGGMLGEASA